MTEIASSSSLSFPSSRTKPNKMYHIFLSFRGVDTRTTFTSHLHAALDNRGITTFRDDNELEPGDEISPTLVQAIEDSRIAVIVFSENYATSSWCLNELLEILRCKATKRTYVIPIFYRVEPTQVRWQKGTYELAFHKHNQRYNVELVNSWRTALESIASNSGHNSTNYSSDANMIDAIVEDILKKLDPVSFDDSQLLGIVGIEERVEEIKSLLCLDSQTLHKIGVWGLGGIGKTTLARIVYNEVKYHFQRCCFLQNVREMLEKQGETYLRKEFYKQLLGKEEPTFVPETLRSLKALIVLDDVDDPRQLELLGIDKHDYFGHGTRIIVTTRDKRVLERARPYDQYQVKELSDEKALELFQLNSNINVGSNISDNDYQVLSKEVVSYCGGMPLALRILRSLFCGMSKQEWECELKKLKEIPNRDIIAVLKMSYDRLDENLQDIFLDIVCFFRGEEREFVARILNDCGLYATSGIVLLIEKSLIFIGVGNRLQMHDLVQDMGLMIAGKEKPRNQRRITIPREAIDVLQANTENEMIRGIFLNIDLVRDQVIIHHECFRNMSNLKFFIIHDSYKPIPYYFVSSNYEVENKIQIPRGIHTLPSELRYLKWARYSYKYLPSKFCPKNLLELIMPSSSLVRLWNGVKPLGKLRTINLSCSKYLVELPNLSNATNLETIEIEGCKQLRQARIPFQLLGKLNSVDLRYCPKLENFIERRPFLSQTYQLEPISSFSVLETLTLQDTSIERVPSAIACLSSLVMLTLEDCTMLKSISRSISKLKILKTLSLIGCPKLESFPEILEPMSMLEELIFQRTGIKRLPFTIYNLTTLKTLKLILCTNLENIPKSIRKLNHLRSLVLLGIQKLEKLPPLPIELLALYVEDCNSLKSLVLPSNLLSIYLSKCLSMEKVLTSTSFYRDPKYIGSYDKTFCDNCPKLEVNAMLTLLYVATLFNNRMPPFLIRWSGNEIRMPHEEEEEYDNDERESSSSWVRVELPQNWCNSDFMTPVFYLVVSHQNKSVSSDNNDGFNGEDYKILCAANFKANHEYYTETFSSVFEVNSKGMNDNIDYNILFIPSDTVGPHGLGKNEGSCCHNFIEVVFNFQSDNLEIKKCGVHMLYTNEVVEYFFANNEEFESDIQEEEEDYVEDEASTCGSETGKNDDYEELCHSSIEDHEGQKDDDGSHTRSPNSQLYPDDETEVPKVAQHFTSLEEIKKMVFDMNAKLDKKLHEYHQLQEAKLDSVQDNVNSQLQAKFDSGQENLNSQLQAKLDSVEENLKFQLQAKFNSIQDNVNARLQEYHHLQQAKLDTIQGNLNSGFEWLKENSCPIT